MKYISMVLILALQVLGCSGSGVDEETVLSDLDTFAGLSKALDEEREFVLYDVRTPEEYTAGHIPGALNISHDIIADTIPVEDKNAVIVLYCRSGNRSGIARRALEALGYKNIVDFGGVSKWRGELVTGELAG